MRKISSTYNVRSKDKKLQNRFRDNHSVNEDQQLWLYGLHAVSAALMNPHRSCQELLATKNGLSRLRETLESLTPERQPKTRMVSAGDIKRCLGPGVVHQGLALRAKQLPGANINTTCPPEKNSQNLVVVLDQVTDPHNVGAILRSCAAFGARALVVTQAHAPAESGALGKAASGALETLPYIIVTNLARSLDNLADLGYWRVGLASQAEKTLPHSDTTNNIALVLGAEGKGLRRLTKAKCDQLIKLPTHNRHPNLNVSNAAAIAMYEIARRSWS